MRIAVEEPPDLVLLDRQLPGVDGLVVLRQLRNDPATARIPVVVVSAEAAPANVAALLDAGGADSVVKPFDVNGLLRVIADALARRTVCAASTDGDHGAGGAAADEPAGGEVDAPVDLVALSAQLGELRVAVVRGDASAVGELVHDLKGSASFFACRRLARRCEDRLLHEHGWTGRPRAPDQPSARTAS